MDADKILTRFCKRLVALDMDIFGLRKQAQDADIPESEIKGWRSTESGAHFPVKNGQTVAEAAKEFVAKKKEEKPKSWQGHKYSKEADKLYELGYGNENEVQRTIDSYWQEALESLIKQAEKTPWKKHFIDNPYTASIKGYYTSGTSFPKNGEPVPENPYIKSAYMTVPPKPDDKPIFLGEREKNIIQDASLLPKEEKASRIKKINDYIYGRENEYIPAKELRDIAIVYAAYQGYENDELQNYAKSFYDDVMKKQKKNIFHASKLKKGSGAEAALPFMPRDKHSYEAFSDYSKEDTLGNYREINLGLRRGAKLSDAAFKNIKEIDRYFAKCPGLTAPAQFYRGLQSDDAVKNFVGKDLYQDIIEGLRSGKYKIGDKVKDAVGKEITDYGFGSASWNKKQAEKFAGGSMVTIKAPKGGKVISIPFNEYGEDEAIFDRGSKFHISSIKIKNFDEDGLYLDIGLTLDDEVF